MDSVSASLILKALDGLSARAVATAENIANANTPNYRPVRVAFEELLAAAANGGPSDIGAVRPTIVRAPLSEPLRLDLELSTASSTAMRYAALVDLLGRQLQIQNLSITGSR